MKLDWKLRTSGMFYDELLLEATSLMSRNHEI